MIVIPSKRSLFIRNVFELELTYSFISFLHLGNHNNIYIYLYIIKTMIEINNAINIQLVHGTEKFNLVRILPVIVLKDSQLPFK